MGFEWCYKNESVQMRVVIAQNTREECMKTGKNQRRRCVRTQPCQQSPLLSDVLVLAEEDRRPCWSLRLLEQIYSKAAVHCSVGGVIVNGSGDRERRAEMIGWLEHGEFRRMGRAHGFHIERAVVEATKSASIHAHV